MPQNKVINTGIYENGLCAKFYRWSDDDFRGNSRLGTYLNKINELDENGRTILHHIYLQSCYTKKGWFPFTPDFNDQLKLLTKYTNLNIFVRDIYDKFAFEYVEQSYLDSLDDKEKQKLYPAVRFVNPEIKPSDSKIFFYSSNQLGFKTEVPEAYFSVYESNVVHPYSGNNIFHKLASSPQITLHYYQLLSFSQNIQTTASLPGFEWVRKETNGNIIVQKNTHDLSFEGLLTSHLLRLNTIDPFAKNFQNQHPFEIAINPLVKNHLYNKFKEGLTVQKDLTELKPYLEYGLRELLDVKLITLLRESGYALCEPDVDLDGNSLIQFVLELFYPQISQWHQALVGQKPSILSDKLHLPVSSFLFSNELSETIKSCSHNMDSFNFEGRSMREILSSLHEIICEKIRYPFLHCASYNIGASRTLKFNSEDIKKEYESRFSAQEESLAKAKLSFNAFKNNLDVLVEEYHQANIKINAIKNFLNPKQWFESLHGQASNSPNLLEATVNAEDHNILFYGFWNIIDNIQSLPDMVFGAKEKNVDYSYAVSLQEVGDNILNLDKFIASVYLNWQAKVQLLNEQEAEVNNLIKLANIKEFEADYLKRLKEIITILKQQHFAQINEQTAPKQFENAYNALKQLYKAGTAHSPQGDELFKTIQKQCREFPQQHPDSDLGVELNFCKAITAWDFSQEWVFV